MDYSILKAFLELFSYSIEDVFIGVTNVSFCIKKVSFDLAPLERLNCLRISFPDRKDFVYYPEIHVTYKDGCRVYQFFYEIDKVVEYINLLNLEY